MMRVGVALELRAHVCLKRWEIVLYWIKRTRNADLQIELDLRCRARYPNYPKGKGGAAVGSLSRRRLVG